MLRGHLPIVIYHQVYYYTKIIYPEKGRDKLPTFGEFRGWEFFVSKTGPSTLDRMRIDLTESVNKFVLQKSIPAQIRQLILYYCQYKE